MKSGEGRAMKLTKAQANLLFDLSLASTMVDTAYKPALTLVDLKLATKKRGGIGVIRVSITEAGRRALAATGTTGDVT